MQIDNNWYSDLPKRRLLLYDKIYLLAMLNFKTRRYRYFDDFYSGLKQHFKIHPSELEHQLPRYQALWNDVKFNTKTKVKASKVENENISLHILGMIGKIVTRSYCLLNHANLKYKDSILEYYNKHGSFIGLRNCGEKTNKILVEICDEWLLKLS